METDATGGGTGTGGVPDLAGIYNPDCPLRTALIVGVIGYTLLRIIK